MAIYLLEKKITDLRHHESNPADLYHHLHQPEKDAIGELIHYQEDHNHLLKRIITGLYEGYIPGLDLLSL